MRFDREKFYAGYRRELAGIARLTPGRIEGLDSLLDFIEGDKFLTRIEWPAYMLGTVMIETAYTFKPIHEYGGHAYFVRRYGSQTAIGKRLGNDTAEEGADYSGVGDVQLTGEDNFERAEVALRKFYPEVVAAFEQRTGRKFDLTVGDQPNDKSDPANAGDPAIAYYIMSFGMRTGMFTGRKLSAGPIRSDWRAIINGKDRAGEIADIARKFLKILNESFISSDTRPLAEVLPTVETEAGLTDKTGSEALQTANKDMPEPAAPPKSTEQTTDVQVDADGNTAVTANTKVGGFKWLVGSIIAIVTGQATVPEFVSNGLQSTSVWTVILNIFQNLWTFKVYIIGGIIIIFLARKIETTALKIAAMRINADPTKANVVLTQPAASGMISWIRGKTGI